MTKKKWIFFLGILSLLLIKNFSSRSPADSTAPKKEMEEPTIANTYKPPAVQPVFQDGMYTLSISSSIGLLTYYNQTDVRWGNAIYGGNDPISDYGCGPTVLSMLVSSFTEQKVLPDAMAAWATNNHYWVDNFGSSHKLIPEGASFYGFSVESFSDYTEQGLINALKDESVFIALMGPGHFTSGGHFIIITGYWEGSSVRVADPNSLENSQTAWEAGLILKELNYAAEAGGPLWRISIK